MPRGKSFQRTVSQVMQRVSLVSTPSKMLCTQVRGVLLPVAPAEPVLLVASASWEDGTCEPVGKGRPWVRCEP